MVPKLSMYSYLKLWKYIFPREFSWKYNHEGADCSVKQVVILKLLASISSETDILFPYSTYLDLLYPYFQNFLWELILTIKKLIWWWVRRNSYGCNRKLNRLILSLGIRENLFKFDIQISTFKRKMLITS